jgi:hypothetical protein
MGPLLRSHLSYKAIFSLSQRWPLNTGLTVYMYVHFLNVLQNKQCTGLSRVRIRVMAVNATFNNISVTSWQLVLLVEETIDLSQVTDKLYHIMLYWVHLTWAGFKLTTLVVIGLICSHKFNHHMITTTTAPGLSKITPKILK